MDPILLGEGLAVLMFFMKDAMGESALATKVLPVITGLVVLGAAGLIPLIAEHHREKAAGEAS